MDSQKADYITAVKVLQLIDWLFGNGLVEAVDMGYTISKNLYAKGCHPFKKVQFF